MVGAEHPSALDINDHLAIVYDGLGRLDDALRTAEWLLEARVKLLGRHDFNTLAPMKLVAMLLIHAGRFAVARTAREELLRGQEAALGVGHPDTSDTKLFLALVAPF